MSRTALASDERARDNPRRALLANCKGKPFTAIRACSAAMVSFLLSHRRMNQFKADLEAIRRNAQMKMEDGAVTPAYKADREKVVDVLNEVLATETVCVLRYRNHYFMARGIDSGPVADEFLEHSNEEQDHADRVARRITELGGNPNFDPNGLHKRSHAEYKEGKTLEAMIREDLVAERIAVATYSEIIRWLGTDDPTTRRMMEDLLAKEEEHADDLANLLVRIEN